MEMKNGNWRKIWESGDADSEGEKQINNQQHVLHERIPITYTKLHGNNVFNELHSTDPVPLWKNNIFQKCQSYKHLLMRKGRNQGITQQQTLSSSRKENLEENVLLMQSNPYVEDIQCLVETQKFLESKQGLHLGENVECEVEGKSKLELEKRSDFQNYMKNNLKYFIDQEDSSNSNREQMNIQVEKSVEEVILMDYNPKLIKL